MSDFVEAEAEVSSGEDEEHTNKEKKKLKRLKQVQSDSSEEEEDGKCRKLPSLWSNDNVLFILFNNLFICNTIVTIYAWLIFFLDEDKIREENRGFIDDEDDEVSASGSDSDGDRHKKRRHDDDDDDLDGDNLDDDDLDLIEENIGVKIDRKVRWVFFIQLKTKNDVISVLSKI